MEQVGRKKSKWGQTTQKMMSFKVDMDIHEELQKVNNKGGFINAALRKALNMTESNENTEEAKEAAK